MIYIKAGIGGTERRKISDDFAVISIKRFAAGPAVGPQGGEWGEALGGHPYLPAPLSLPTLPAVWDWSFQNPLLPRGLGERPCSPGAQNRAGQAALGLWRGGGSAVGSPGWTGKPRPSSLPSRPLAQMAEPGVA